MIFEKICAHAWNMIFEKIQWAHNSQRSLFGSGAIIPFGVSYSRVNRSWFCRSLSSSMDRCHQANDSYKGAQESRDNHRFGDDNSETHFRPIARYLGAGRTIVNTDDQFPKEF